MLGCCGVRANQATLRANILSELRIAQNADLRQDLRYRPCCDLESKSKWLSGIVWSYYTCNSSSTMGAEDVKSMFKAAKAQRGSGASLVCLRHWGALHGTHQCFMMPCYASLQSKEQIKQLRAQKALEAQRAAELAKSQQRRAAAAISVKPKAAAGMPPPPPRAPSGSNPAAITGKSTSVNQPQAAIIQRGLQQGKQDSPAADRPAEQAQPSGVFTEDLCHSLLAIPCLPTLQSS